MYMIFTFSRTNAILFMRQIMTLECKNFGSILIIILNGYKLNLMDVAITFWRILGQKIIKFEPFRVSFISEHPVNLSSFYQENEGKNLNYLLQAMSITEKDELNNIFLSKFNYRGIVVFSALVSISKRKYLPKDARGKAELLPSNCQYTCRCRCWTLAAAACPRIWILCVSYSSGHCDSPWWCDWY